MGRDIVENGELVNATDEQVAKMPPFVRVAYMMARLRDQRTGCEWDIQQNFATIAPYTIEEAYEVADAIERQDWQHLQEELGDLLLQVVFHSQMASEKGYFTFIDVADGLVQKMVRRHPHVFPDGTLQSRIDPDNRPDPDRIRRQWDQIKQAEKQARQASRNELSKIANTTNTDESTLGDVPVGMAPLKRAYKLTKNAAKVGFDWPDASSVVAKLHEEATEIQEALEQGETRERISEEIGDLMFACVNLLRHLEQDPETTMMRANAKFDARYRAMEAYLQAQDQLAQEQLTGEQQVQRESARSLKALMEDTDLATMEAAWQAIKKPPTP